MIENNLKTLSDAIKGCLNVDLWFNKRDELLDRLEPVVDALDLFGVETDKRIHFDILNLRELGLATNALHEAITHGYSSEIQLARRAQFSRQLAVFDRGGLGEANPVVELALLSASVKRMYDADGITYWVLRGRASRGGLDSHGKQINSPYMARDGMVYLCDPKTLEQIVECAPEGWTDDAIVEGPMDFETWKARFQPD